MKHFIIELSVISSLSKNHINIVDTWLKLEEIIRNLNSTAFDQEKYPESIIFSKGSQNSWNKIQLRYGYTCFWVECNITDIV